MGFNGGIIPEEFTANSFPFSNTIWLCKSPSFAVRWYSSLMASLILGFRIILENFVLFVWFGSFFVRVIILVAFMKEIPTFVVLLPSRLINSNVIPACKIWDYIKLVKITRCNFLYFCSFLLITYRNLWAVSIRTYFICATKICW